MYKIELTMEQTNLLQEILLEVKVKAEMFEEGNLEPGDLIVLDSITKAISKAIDFPVSMKHWDLDWAVSVVELNKERSK